MHDLKLIMRKQSDQTEGHSTKYLLKNVKRLRTVDKRRAASAGVTLCCRQNDTHQKGQGRAGRQNVNLGCTLHKNW